MQVESARAPATCEYDAQQFYFCSDRCREKFETNAESLTGAARASAGANRRGPG
jgi:YHS domain-containing protein